MQHRIRFWLLFFFLCRLNHHSRVSKKWWAQFLEKIGLVLNKDNCEPCMIVSKMMVPHDQSLKLIRISELTQNVTQLNGSWFKQPHWRKSHTFHCYESKFLSFTIETLCSFVNGIWKLNVDVTKDWLLKRNLKCLHPAVLEEKLIVSSVWILFSAIQQHLKISYTPFPKKPNWQGIKHDIVFPDFLGPIPITLLCGQILLTERH